MENKQLQIAKDTIAKKYGYANFEQFDDKSTFGYNHDTPKIIDEVAIEYHRLMSEWVSVDERFPEIGIDDYYPYSSDMILITDGELVYYGQYEKSPDFKECFIDTDGNDYEDSEIKITHWMHTPQPPK
jgi:hypothetical protein